MGLTSDDVRTEQFPTVTLVEAPGREEYIMGGDAQRVIDANPLVNVGWYDPRARIMAFDPVTGIAVTRRMGTRITPLSSWTHLPVGAMSRAIASRQHGIPAAVGHGFLVESDDPGVDQGMVSRLAMGF